MYFPSREYGNQVLSEMIRVTKIKKTPSIFIGDIPIESHNPRHMTYERNSFEEISFKTIRGWADPYKDTRFNAWM